MNGKMRTVKCKMNDKGSHGAGKVLNYIAWLNNQANV